MIEPIGFARALAGAKPFTQDNMNATFRGLILLDDAGSTTTAVLKDLDARELANELLGASLARALELPCPAAYLTAVPPDAFTATKAPVSVEGERLVFASSDMSVPSVRFQYLGADPERQRFLVSAVAALPMIGRYYAFDSWIANVDRNAGNLLYGGPEEAWLIDHGQILGSPAWTPAGLSANGEYPHRLGEWLTPFLSRDQVTRAISEAYKLEHALAHVDVDAVIAASHIASILPTGDVEAARDFLAGRLIFTGYYASKALGEARIV
ncbi:HipA family kinase [Sphingomonas sp. 3-13AW]|uniref:HipA family kinase n=1 Tax=Sphingomonas sp. 3-13AW TaxID=3050450 RepID=UPI003BB67AE9